MTSRSTTSRVAYVWGWLPGALDPLVIGALQATGELLHGNEVLAFRYASSYRERTDAINLFAPELPLTSTVLDPRRPNHGRTPLALAGSLRDGAPDAWGRRVINQQLAGSPDTEFSELTYLLRSGSNRIGALDFQHSPTEYVSRGDGATIEHLAQAADLIDRGEPLPANLAAAAMHGTSIGGARPKALLSDEDGQQLIAKFSSSDDSRPVVKAEAVAMILAENVGIDVAPVRMTRAIGKDVLLVTRFDRIPQPGGRQARKHMLSMLTVLGLDAMSSRHTSYAYLAETIRTGPWVNVSATLEELFTRLVFNIFVGNTDDHMRNLAAFWDGKCLELTPAYDLAPQIRSTNTSSQAIGITRDGARASQLRLCAEVASEFNINTTRAANIIEHVRATIVSTWDEAADLATLTRNERKQLWGREFFNPYIFYSEA